MDYIIKITERHHLVEWLRFIQDSRPKTKLSKIDLCIFDFRNARFIRPVHLSTLACLIEEYHSMNVRLKFKIKPNSSTGRFLTYIKFDKYWNKNFDRNNCFLNLRKDILPVWQLQDERIDSFGKLAQEFYTKHCSPGKDLTALRLTVVEALNNIQDHSESKVSGFVFTQYFKPRSELIISICDFGVGIANKVNSYLKKEGAKELTNAEALEKALQLGFTTKSKPNNAGRGLDNILSYVKTTNGEIQIITNRALYSNKVKNSIPMPIISDDMKLSFNGTVIEIKLDTRNFIPVELEVSEILQLF